MNDGTQNVALKVRVEVGTARDVVGIHCGGGVGNRWSYVVVGKEVDATIAADHYNSPGK